MRLGMRLFGLIALAALVLTGGEVGMARADTHAPAWITQYGTSADEYFGGMALDSAGNAYITGYSRGGSYSSVAFLAKCSSTGILAWTTQSSDSAYAYAISDMAVDSAGNAYVVGYRGGPYDRSAFLSKYTPTGNLAWTEQRSSSGYTYGSGVSVDSAGNAYITGYFNGNLAGNSQGYHDVFVAKYTSNGLAWTTQFGTSSEDIPTGMATDSTGNVYVTGWTSGSLDGKDHGVGSEFLAKCTSTGSLAWTAQFGTSANNYNCRMAVDHAGNSYITGTTMDNLGGTNQGGKDVFLAKYDSTGAPVWTTQLGTSADDIAGDVAVDGTDSIYITGGTYGSLGGANQGGGDAFLANYTSSGILTWVTQFGTSSNDGGGSVAVDSANDVYVAGGTSGSLGGTNQGSYDAFVAKFEVPEPATLSLLALGGLAMLRSRRRAMLLSLLIAWGGTLTLSSAASADVFNLGGVRDPLTGHWTGTASLETVPVGDLSNAADSAAHSGNPAGQGSVGYAYNIGKYEVTAGQYCEFLNAVAKTDTYGLYDERMNVDSGLLWAEYSCNIKRSGSSGSYNYTVATDFANRPVNCVSFWDACRFANWLNNGQPTGLQGAGTTETGTYTLNGYNGNFGQSIQRNAGATWAVTSEDEWYKAAYYDPTLNGGTGGYWDYPTRSNTAPGQDMADASSNNANYWAAPYAYPIDNGKYTTVAGEFQNSPGPYGTFDQGGNVWEWNEATPFQGYGSRGLLGQSFDGGRYDMVSSYRYSLEYFGYPTNLSFHDGFRVSEVPEPASMALLTLGGLAVLKPKRS